MEPTPLDHESAEPRPTQAAPGKGATIRKWLNRLLQVGIVAFLVWQLTDVGWGEVLRNLPTNPLFYMVQVFIYMALPVSDLLIYRRQWEFRFWDGLPIFIYKKIYNADVMTYSGEVYLYYWARKSFAVSKRAVWELIRDNNILSSVSSTMLAVVLVGLFLWIGHINLLDLIGEERKFMLGWIMLLFAVLFAVAWHFRRFLFSMPRREAFAIFAIHIARLLVINVFQLLQWVIGMPRVALTQWYSLLAVQLIGNRIPFVPNKDLLFAAVAIGIAGPLGLNQAQLAPVLLVPSVMNKVFNLVFFVLVSFSPTLQGLKPAEDPQMSDPMKIDDPAQR